jgi:hypothetical protein
MIALQSVDLSNLPSFLSWKEMDHDSSPKRWGERQRRYFKVYDAHGIWGWRNAKRMQCGGWKGVSNKLARVRVIPSRRGASVKNERGTYLGVCHHILWADFVHKTFQVLLSLPSAKPTRARMLWTNQRSRAQLIMKFIYWIISIGRENISVYFWYMSKRAPIYCTGKAIDLLCAV